MKTIEKIVKCSRTKTGIPYLWESLSQEISTNGVPTIRSQNIVNSLGEFKYSIFKNKYYDKKSLVPITETDYIIKSFYSKSDNNFTISIFRIVEVFKDSNGVKLESVFRKQYTVHPNLNLIACVMTDSGLEFMESSVFDVIEKTINERYETILNVLNGNLNEL